MPSAPKQASRKPPVTPPAAEGTIATTGTTPPDWDAIRQRYVDGVAVDDLAKLFNVSQDAIQKQSWRNHWKDLQAKSMAKLRVTLEAELKHCFFVSILREAREYRDLRLLGALDPDVVSKCRTRCYELASKLLGWDTGQAAAGAKGRVIDV